MCTDTYVVMNVRLGLHITWLHLFTSSLNRNTSRTHSLHLRLSIHIWYIFPWQQIPFSGSHTELNSGVIQHYNSQGHLQTHSSRALTSSHTVNSPSSLEVINDFPWLLSSSPSTVNPLFFIEAPQPHYWAISLPAILESTEAGTPQEEREVLAAGTRQIFMTQWGYQQTSGDTSYHVCASATCKVSWRWRSAQTHITPPATQLKKYWSINKDSELLQ